MRGTIFAGPTCPVQRVDSPCPDQPVSLTVEVVQGNTVVATFTSDANGKFSVALPVGTFGLRSKGGLPVLHGVTVVVVNGQYSDLDLQADTGIR